MRTYDGLVYDDKIGWYDPEIAVCIEDGCTEPGNFQRLVSMFQDDFVVEMVCANHDN